MNFINLTCNDCLLPRSCRYDTKTLGLQSGISCNYSASSIYINGITTVTHGNHQVSRDYVFTIYVHDEAFSVNSESFIDMGYKVFYKKPYLVELRSDIGSNYVYCEPEKIASNSTEQSSLHSVSLLN